jgi:hypothetical protein
VRIGILLLDFFCVEGARFSFCIYWEADEIQILLSHIESHSLSYYFTFLIKKNPQKVSTIGNSLGLYLYYLQLLLVTAHFKMQAQSKELDKSFLDTIKMPDLPTEVLVFPNHWSQPKCPKNSVTHEATKEIMKWIRVVPPVLVILII